MFVRASITAPARTHLFDGRRVLGRNEVLERCDPFTRRIASDIEVDLHCEGHAVESAERLARLEGSVSGVSVGEDLVGPHLDHGVDLVIDKLDALEV